MINVSTSLNRKYVDYTCVMLASLCENTKDESVRAFILHCELTPEDEALMQSVLEDYDIELCFLHIDQNRFDAETKSSDLWSIETYFRLFLPDVLPEDVDRILYLDVDVIVNHPIGEFYHTDFEGNEIVATVDNSGLLIGKFSGMRQEKLGPILEKEGNYYFNAGVALLNMEEIRKRCSFETYVEAMREWNYEMVAFDQDIWNYVHGGRVKYVDPMKWDAFAIHIYNFGVMDMEEFEKTAAIIHFSGPKPWNHKATHFPFERIWWDYAKKLSIYNKLVDQFLDELFLRDYLRKRVNDLVSERDSLKQRVDELSKAVMEMVEMNEKLLNG